MQKKLGLGLIFLVSTTLGGIAAETVRFDHPDADTYVLASQPEKNFGADASFQVRRSDNRKFSRIGYVRFALEDRLTARVDKAAITLTLGSLFKERNNPGTINIYGWAGGDWDESTLTDANAFWSSADTAKVPAGIKLLGSITVPAVGGAQGGSPFTLTSSALAEFLESARQAKLKKVTFLIVEETQSPSVVTFISKENPSFSSTSLVVELGQ